MRIGGQTPIAELFRQATPVARLSFSAGDVITATVVAQQGENILLRTRDGELFQARLETGETLMPSDEIECMVSGRDQQRINLRLVTINPSSDSILSQIQQSAASRHPSLEGLSAQDRFAVGLLSVLEQMGVRPSAQMLAQALTIADATGLDERGAAFFAANGIEPTEENVAAYKQFESGRTIGRELFDISAAIEYGTDADTTQAALRGSAQGQASPASAAETAPPQQLAAQGGAEADTEPQQGNPASIMADGDESAPVQPRASAQQPIAGQIPLEAPGTGEARLQQAAPEAFAAATAVAPDGDEPGRMLTVTAQAENSSEALVVRRAGQSAAFAQPLPAAESGATPSQALSSKLMSFFMRIDAGTDGEAVREAVDSSKQIALLKETLQRSAEPLREGLSQRIDQVSAQSRFTQDISRFYCAQIPVQLGSPDTAELYIYRQKRRDKGIDPEDTAILLALGTQSMGRVEALIRVRQRSISLSFKIENEARIDDVRLESEGLYAAFGDLGFSLTDIRVAPLEERITPSTAQQTLLKAVHRPRVLLDRLI